MDNPHQRLVTSVPEAYSVLLSEVGRKHPMSNQVRFPSTAVNAMELSAIHASQIAVHQQRSNNLILENMTEACSDSDKLKQLIMENGHSMPTEAKTQLISLIDDLTGRLSTSCLASCISAPLDAPLLEHIAFNQASCEVGRKNKIISDTPFHSDLPVSSTGKY